MIVAKKKKIKNEKKKILKSTVRIPEATIVKVLHIRMKTKVTSLNVTVTQVKTMRSLKEKSIKRETAQKICAASQFQLLIMLVLRVNEPRRASMA